MKDSTIACVALFSVMLIMGLLHFGHEVHTYETDDAPPPPSTGWEAVVWLGVVSGLILFIMLIVLAVRNISQRSSVPKSTDMSAGVRYGIMFPCIALVLGIFIATIYYMYSESESDPKKAAELKLSFTVVISVIALIFFCVKLPHARE